MLKTSQVWVNCDSDILSQKSEAIGVARKVAGNSIDVKRFQSNSRYCVTKYFCLEYVNQSRHSQTEEDYFQTLEKLEELNKSATSSKRKRNDGLPVINNYRPL